MWRETYLIVHNIYIICPMIFMPKKFIDEEDGNFRGN